MKKNLLLLFASVVFAFAVGEIFCRVKGSYLSYNERTGAGGYTSPFETDNRGWTHSYTPFEKHRLERNEFTDSWAANEDGLKEKRISENKTGKRILVLGDSFTEGVGAPPDSSYPRILESILQRSDSSIEVINGGAGGSDIFFEYKMLQALYGKYKPDAVIVTCNPSDIPEYLTRGGFERFAADGSLKYRNGPWFEPLYAHSLLVRLLVHDVFKYDFNFIRQHDYDSEVKMAKNGMCAAIDSFQLFCKVNQIGFAMVFHPFSGDIQHPELYSMKGLIAYCHEKNIPCTDALNFLNKQGINDKNWKNIYWEKDGHFNSKGYGLLALCAHQLIEEKGWLSQPNDGVIKEEVKQN